jgi:hypothetical protein
MLPYAWWLQALGGRWRRRRTYAEVGAGAGERGGDGDGSDPDWDGYGWYWTLGCLTAVATLSWASDATMATTRPLWATPVWLGARHHAMAVGLHGWPPSRLSVLLTS